MRLARRSFGSAAVLSLALLVTGCGGSGSADGASGATGPTGAPSSGPATAVTAVSGAQAGVVAGATAAIQLTAKVADAGGRGVAGATVTWATQSGTITPGSGSTDGSGQSTAQWTPGTIAGSQTAVASVSGVGSASFPATVSAGALAKLKVAPDTIKLAAVGQTGVVAVAGSDAFDNSIPPASIGAVFTSDNPAVATVTSTGTVAAVANGTTTIRATAGSVTASAIAIVTIASGSGGGSAACTPATLSVGASLTLSGPAASQFCISGSAGAEFVAVPFYATGNTGSGSGQKAFVAAPTFTATFTPMTNVAAVGPPSPSLSGDGRLRGSVLTDGGRVMTRDAVWEARFRERSRREMTPFFSAFRKRTAASSSVRRNTVSISPAVLSVGQSITLNTNANEGCTNPKPHTATVMSVSAHAIVVNDDQNPPGGLTQADFDAIAATFDSQVWLVDTDNFGVPTDIDSNGNRVILFFTSAVNALTPKGSNSFVGGFFYSRDYLSTTGASSCAGSNFAEMFYLLAADPSGAVSTAHSASFVKSVSIGTVAHEFQHLINFTRHASDLNPTPFTAFEESFLDEGLAHVAEELNFYAAAGLTPRSNLGVTQATANPSAYSAFADQNARRFREYLKSPDVLPPYSVLVDSSLAVRGGIWSFLRYAADQRNSAVPEKTTWFQLVNPTSDVQGINNLKAVFGADVLSKMRDWAVANYLDDALSVPTAQAFQHLSWNTRSIETSANGPNGSGGSIFPLKVTSLTGSTVSLSLADGGAAYLRFGVGAGQVGGATVTSGTALPATFSITVVRTK